MALEILGYIMCRVRLGWLVNPPLEVLSPSKLVYALLKGAELFSGCSTVRAYYDFKIIKQVWFLRNHKKRSEQKQSGVVEVVTTTFDESRTSYPVEFFYDKVACEAGCTEDLAECIIQCQTDNACISDCNRAFSKCLNSFC